MKVRSFIRGRWLGQPAIAIRPAVQFCGSCRLWRSGSRRPVGCRRKAADSPVTDMTVPSSRAGPLGLRARARRPASPSSCPDFRCFAISARKGYERPSPPAWLPFLPWRWRQMRNSTAPAATTIAATRPLTASGSTGASTTGQSHVRTCGADRSSSSYALVMRAGALRLRGQDRSG
jgi:hypothetical protein